jgi:predicted ester cyclase
MSTNRTTANKASYRRLCEVVNTGDATLVAKAIDEVFEPDVRNSTPLPVSGTGTAALKQVWTMLLDAFPDLHIAVEEMIAEDDRVAVRNTVTGTQTGEYLGGPPTGRPVRYSEMFVLRFAGGRVTEIAGVVDVLSQLRQLGSVPGHH